jgi:hypothetical protein
MKRLPKHSPSRLVQTEPLAQFGIFRPQLLRQQLTEPLVFLFELYKSCQLIAGREGLRVLSALLRGRLRSTFPMIVGLL